MSQSTWLCSSCCDAHARFCPPTVSGAALINAYMAVNPAPTWLIADSAPYFSSSELSDFCARSGIGLLIAPSEAHWLMGHDERKIPRLVSLE